MKFARINCHDAKSGRVISVSYTHLKQYANGFEDPANGKECALALYGMGCDIVFQVAGKTGEGVFEAAAETGNYAIGVDGDQKYINPDVIICSMVKKVEMCIRDRCTRRAISCFSTGTGCGCRH